MIKVQGTPRSFWFAFLAASIFISVLALYQAVPEFAAQNISLWHSKWTALWLALLLNAILDVFLIIGLRRGLFDKLIGRFDSASSSGIGSAPAILILFAAPALFWFIRLNIFGSILPQLFPSLWILIWLSLIASMALKALTKNPLAVSFVAMLLMQGVLFRCWSLLNVVTDSPFTIDYSETSRFYYGSLVFSRSLYGMDLPLSTLHPSRYLLQAIPFIIPNLPLWAHRLWQALLWIVLTGSSAWLLARRMKLSNRYLTALVAAWGFVYFLQGSVYYHLQVCVIIILLGASIKRPWQTLIAVILSSFWAGISRVNWFPVPAMLAIAIYLLEEPVSTSKNIWYYLRHPVLWTVAGITSAAVSQVLYIYWSGNANNAGDFGSSFTSDLIWSRLLPNITYPMGVLLAILIVSVPLLAVLFYAIRSHGSSWHMLRPLGLFSMLAALFIGGLVVSTKIGGGADIHNMDAFMVLLAIVVCAFLGNQVAAEKTGSSWGTPPIAVIMLMAFVPVIFSVSGVQPRYSYNHVQAQKDLESLQSILSEAHNQGGEVLFINQRQLVTFHIVNGVSLTPDYEIVTLMEMAMSGNQTYLDRFDKDLASHRFSVIVTPVQRVVKKTNEPFSEENNVWIDSISRPLLCYYDRKTVLESSNTLILVPAKEKGNCP